MDSARGFPKKTVEFLRSSQIIGIRAGNNSYRFIGVWVVVVEDRVFVRSWGVKPNGWFCTLEADPQGRVQVLDGREFRIRAVFTRSERLKTAVDKAYAEKYHTPASMKWVRDLIKPRCRNTTTELVPVTTGKAAKKS